MYVFIYMYMFIYMYIFTILSHHSARCEVTQA